MDFVDLVKKRRSCHHFLPGKSISDDDLKKMIECAALTPSGYNAQPWEFVVVRKKENILKLQEIAFKQDHIGDASAVIVVLADLVIGRNVEKILSDWLKYGYCSKEEIPAYRNSIAKNRSEEKRKIMGLRNAMLAAMTLIYAAEDMGYATCPLMGVSQWQLEEFLEIPNDRVLALMVAVGYEDLGKENKRLPRKTVDELVHWEKWGK